MREPRSSVSPKTLTERVAGWSIRHRKTAVLGWLVLVLAVFIGSQAIGSASLDQYDAGQSGQAERVLYRAEPAQYDAYGESVLIQAKTSGATRQAASAVVAALATRPRYATDINSPQVSKDGRSVLVTFEVPGTVSSVEVAATTLQGTVAAVQARYPNLFIAVTGDASVQQAINNALNFTKAEEISIRAR
jgi:RND superfamily putative drug exporter